MRPQDKARTNRIRIWVQHLTMKDGLDILTNINKDECHLKFTKEGFSVTCVTPVQQQGKKSKGATTEIVKRSQTDYEFYGTDLIKYDYRLMSTDRTTAIPRYECTANTVEFLHRVKGLKEKVIRIEMAFKDGNCKEMAFSVQGSAATTYLKIKQPTRRTAYTNQLDTWFKDKLPIFKPECSAFKNMIQSAKQNKCNDIEFVLNKRTKNFSVRGWDGDVFVFGNPMRDLEDSSYEEDAPDDPYYSRHIDLSQNEWISNIHKMCPDSIVRIYMGGDENAPLIMTTYIGHHGQAIYSVPDSTIA